MDYPLWKSLLNPEIIKKCLKFCKDHQYKAKFEKLGLYKLFSFLA